MTPGFFNIMGCRWFNRPSLSRTGSEWALVMAMILIFPGCHLTSREMVRFHAFDYPAPVEKTPAPALGTLMVYRFLLAPSVEPDSLIVSQPAGKERAIVSHRWAQNPADMITELIQRDLAESALFERTVGQYSSVRYRYALEGKILSLRGIEGNGNPRALLEADAALTDFGAPLGVQKSMMERRYRIEAPCPNATPAAMVIGLNQAVRELSSRLLKDIRTALEKKGDPKPSTQLLLAGDSL